MAASRIETYNFTARDQLLFDANIWIFLYCPHGNPNAHQPQVYSAAFKKILAAGSRIFLSGTILSEFVYRYCRLTHALLLAKGSAPEEFKKFRQTAKFRPVAKAVAEAASRLSKQATRINEDFAATDITSILTQFESGNYDWNDLLTADLCSQKGLTLVTDDEDFSERRISILTANAMMA